MQLIKKIIVIGAVFFFLIGILFDEKAFAVSIRKEEEMSREFMKVVSRYYEFIEDQVINDYLNKVGQKIVSVLPPQPFRYNFYIIKENVYNAFASPAGNIFINSGLLAAMENEDELAGILAHEIAHVKCRHISHNIERASKIGMLTLAGVAAGILLGIGGSSAAASALTIGSTAAGQTAALAYSREDEMQADQLGMTYLAKAGYSAAGLLLMLKKIRGKESFSPGQIPTYLTTHPATDDRIGYISTWIEANQKHEQQVRLNKSNEFDFESVHTRLIIAYGEESAVLKKFKAEAEKYPEDPLAQYRYGLILERIGNHKDAAAHIKKALAKKAFDPYILKDLGKILFFNGSYDEAFQALKSSISIHPNDLEGLFFLGRTQIKLEKFDQAVFTFENLIKNNNADKQALYFLGKTYGKLGKFAKSHYYTGIYYKKTRNIKNAVFHLKKALEKTTDPQMKLEINKILKKIEESRQNLKNS